MPAPVKWLLISGLIALFVFAGDLMGPPRRVTAQDSGIALWDLGTKKISGNIWNFEGDFAIDAGAWESVTVSNYNYCFVGPNDPREGTAHAGAIFWFTELQAMPFSEQGPNYTGTLQSGRSNDAGRVAITTTYSGTTANTHVSVTISGSDLMYYQDNTLGVCLLGST